MLGDRRIQEPQKHVDPVDPDPDSDPDLQHCSSQCFGSGSEINLKPKLLLKTDNIWQLLNENAEFKNTN